MQLLEGEIAITQGDGMTHDFVAGDVFLAGAVDHHSLAGHRYQTVFFKRLEYAPCHFPGAAYDLAQLLSGDFYLHPVR